MACQHSGISYGNYTKHPEADQAWEKPGEADGDRDSDRGKGKTSLCFIKAVYEFPTLATLQAEDGS